MPHGFTMKLRNLLKQKKLISVATNGYDRTLVMKFGGATLVLEFFAGGNVVVLDEMNVIQCSLRSFKNERVDYSVGQVLVLQCKEYQKQDFFCQSVRNVCGDNVEAMNALVEKRLRDPCSGGVVFVEGDAVVGYSSVEKGNDRSGNPNDKNDQNDTTKQNDPDSNLSKLFFPSFNDAVDNFYSSKQQTRQKSKQHSNEQSLQKKLQLVRTDHENRLKSLQQQQQQLTIQATIIENNVTLVEQCISVIREALKGGMDWKELELLIAAEKEAMNPVAGAIAGLKLDKGVVCLCVDSIEVDINIGYNPHGNIDLLYGKSKCLEQKYQRTLAATAKALKNAEQQIKRKSATAATPQTRTVHKPLWFQKFNWFISSDGYLVLSGRDMQQNEYLVKRHFRSTDLYVHADVVGAATVIVKNERGGVVPPSTLGTWALCNSRAWDNKIVTSAWWVTFEQVSKTAPSGEYLTTGSFMIRGKKNFLSATRLVLGFGVLFKLDDTSIKRRIECGLIKEEGEVESNKLEKSDELEDQLEKSDELEDQLEKSDELEDHQDELEKLQDKDELEKSDSINQGIEKTNNQDAKKQNDDINDSDDEFPDVHIEGQIEDEKEIETVTESENVIGIEQEEEIEQLDNDNVSRDFKQKPEKTNESINSKKAPRGKKGKMKKIQKKYKHQDDEEREQKMMLLASEKKNVAKQMKNVGKSTKKGSKNGSSNKQDSNNDSNNKNESKNENDKIANESNRNAESNFNNFKPIVEDENEFKDTKSLLFALIPTPTPDDVLVQAIPVCAPYSSLNNYRYKVKMTPGGLKKGKACKLAVQLFMTIKSDCPMEKVAVKNVPDMEWIAAMMGKVKLSAPNLEVVKKKKNKNKD